MKKFTNLSNNNKTTETSDNRADFIKNLINESLTVENGQILGMDTLSTTINKIMDINESKTTIKILENIKLLSTRTLNLQTINESIEFEKKKILDLKSDVAVEEPIIIGLISESVKHEDDKECKDGECKDGECKDGKCKDEEEEDDDKIEKDKEKSKEKEKVAESVNRVFVIDSESTTEIGDLAKMYESIKNAPKE